MIFQPHLPWELSFTEQYELNVDLDNAINLEPNSIEEQKKLE